MDKKNLDAPNILREIDATDQSGIINEMRENRDDFLAANTSFTSAISQQTIWRYGYDKDGYINLAEYIVGIDFQ